MKKIIAAALALSAAAIVAITPRAASVHPYTVGPLGRSISSATVHGMYSSGDKIKVQLLDDNTGDCWFYLVDAETKLRIYDKVTLVINGNGTPDNYSDDYVEDVLFCHDCDDCVD